MKPYDFAPLFRSTIGFDRVFYVLDSLTQKEPSSFYPPYNIERFGGSAYCITIAVSGFRAEDLEIILDNQMLCVQGQLTRQPETFEYLHHGISSHPFQKFFQLADYIKIIDAQLQNGLLKIYLEGEKPDKLKPIKIEIGKKG